MRLEISHQTQYLYAQPVRESSNDLRLKPVSNEHQTVEWHELKIRPQAVLRSYEDFYANTVHHFEVNAAHSELSIESRCRVSTNLRNFLDPDATPASLARRSECIRMERCFDYLQDSNYVKGSPELWRLALDATDGQSDMWQAAQALNRFVQSHLAYTPLATTALTSAAEALERRVGVCQDFAHVLIGLCRSIQLPALYVSGYFFTPGVQASHAWVEVYIPDVGWRALDPTHATQPDERYVKTAVGRDYADVAPTRGHYKGTVQRTIRVDVTVEEISAESTPGTSLQAI